jgi:hypothetical protein
VVQNPILIEGFCTGQRSGYLILAFDATLIRQNDVHRQIFSSLLLVFGKDINPAPNVAAKMGTAALFKVQLKPILEELRPFHD